MGLFSFLRTGKKQKEEVHSSNNEESKANQLLEQAELFHAQGDYIQAIRTADTYLKLYSPYSKVYYQRGLSKLSLFNYMGALDDFNFALKLDPNNGVYGCYRGLAKSGLNDHAGAIADYNWVLKLFPDNSRIYYNRGNDYAAMRWYKEAIADYTKTIELEPSYAEAWCNRGIAKVNTQLFDSAISDFDTALGLLSTLYNALHYRGQAKAELGQYEQAISDFDKSLDIGTNAAHTFVERAKAKTKLGDIAGAISDYTLAIATNDVGPDHYYASGLLKAHIGDNIGAVADFSEALLFECYDEFDYGSAYYSRALINDKLGNPNEVAKDIESAFLCSLNVQSYNQRDVSQRIIGDLSQTVKHFISQAEQNPTNAECRLTLGTLLLFNGKYSEALETLNESISIQPDNLRAYKRRAYIYRELKNNEKAIEDMIYVVNNTKLNGAEKIELGLMYHSIGNYKEAIPYFTEMLDKMAPTFVPFSSFASSIFVYRAKSYLALGNKAAARYDLEKATSLGHPTAGSLLLEHNL